jgi:gluconolactonase
VDDPLISSKIVVLRTDQVDLADIWASAGWIGDGYDGVHVFNSEGKLIGFIKLPETASNVCFGGPKRNRLFITASQSLYSVYVNTRGAHHC